MALGFDLNQVQEICGTAAGLVTLNPGDFLFHEGDPAEALYLVKKGLLRIVSGSTVYETVRAGGIVGEMGIVEKGGRRSASVIAGTRAELRDRCPDILVPRRESAGFLARGDARYGAA